MFTVVTILKLCGFIHSKDPKSRIIISKIPLDNQEKMFAIVKIEAIGRSKVISVSKFFKDYGNEKIIKKNVNMLIL